MAVKIFISYPHVERKYKTDLEDHLAVLKRQNLVETWTDGSINPGSEWNNEIKNNLKEAKVILLLISPKFLSSEYINKIELKEALERHNNKSAIVIPIIIKYCDWENSIISKLQVLPTDGKPVESWQLKTKAYLDIVAGIRKVIQDNPQINSPSPELITQIEKVEHKPEPAQAKRTLWDKVKEVGGNLFEFESRFKPLVNEYNLITSINYPNKNERVKRMEEVGIKMGRLINDYSIPKKGLLKLFKDESVLVGVIFSILFSLKNKEKELLFKNYDIATHDFTKMKLLEAIHKFIEEGFIGTYDHHNVLRVIDTYSIRANNDIINQINIIRRLIDI